MLFSFNITKVQAEYFSKQSDHASHYVELQTNEEIVMGQGLTKVAKVNAAVLEDWYKPNVAREEIKEMLCQITVDWDAHKRLEY
jgi:hypothetical protein